MFFFLFELRPREVFLLLMQVCGMDFLNADFTCW